MPLRPGDEVTTASFAKYSEQYPQYAWAFQDPEVAYWLDRAVREKMGPEELQGWIMQTAWWKSKTAAERDWLQTFANNPADANRQAWNYDSITKYMKMSSDYGLYVSFDQAQQQVFRVVNGTSTPDALEEELRRQAKALYPNLSDVIDRGSTLEDVFADYRNRASSLLGISADEIKLTDPKWQKALKVTDKNGVSRQATAEEWETMLRTDPKYGYADSKQGREDGFGIGNAIAKTFGNVA